MIEQTYPIAEKLLAKGEELSRRLLDLLSQEEQILRQRSPAEELTLVAEGKKETILRMEEFSKQLAKLLSTENLTLHRDDMATYLNIASAAGLPTSVAHDRWCEIIEVGKQCRDMNERNGAAIALLARYNHRMLAILRGQSQTATTYGPDGATRASAFSQPLVSV